VDGVDASFRTGRMGGDAVGGDFNAFIGFLYIEVFRQGFAVDAGILVQYDCCLVRIDV